MVSEIEIDDVEVEFDPGFIDLSFKNLGRRGINNDNGSESLYYKCYRNDVITFYYERDRIDETAAEQMTGPME
jgi:hypothetical protein